MSGGKPSTGMPATGAADRGVVNHRGGRGQGAGRGGGRSRGRIGGGRGMYDHNFEHGGDFGYGDHGFFSGPGFNPNFGPFPPHFMPGWGWPNSRGFGRRGNFGARGRFGSRSVGGHGGAGRGSGGALPPPPPPNNQATQQQPSVVERNSLPAKYQQQTSTMDSPQVAVAVSAKEENSHESVKSGSQLRDSKVKSAAPSVVEKSDGKVTDNCNGEILFGNDGPAPNKTCYKCGEKGHFAGQCSAEILCDICESTEHMAFRCPVQDESKPVALSVGFANDALGAYYIEHPPIQPIKKSARTALISVSGGSLSEGELIGHLKLIVRQNFSWEVSCVKDNVFKVLFPNRTELLRHTYLVSVNLPNGISLKFEEFVEEEEYYGHLLPTVWLRVLNLPKILRKYKILWAIGNMFGVTQKVDMKTTRANSFGRFCVAVLEPDLVPTKMDVIIGNRFFQLNFEIEPFAPNSGISSVASNGAGRDGGGEDKFGEDTKMDDAHNLESNIPSSDIGSASTLNTLGTGSDVEGSKKMGGDVMDFDWENDDLLSDDELAADKEKMERFLNVHSNAPIKVVKAPSSDKFNNHAVPPKDSCVVSSEGVVSQFTRAGLKTKVSDFVSEKHTESFSEDGSAADPTKDSGVRGFQLTSKCAELVQKNREGHTTGNLAKTNFLAAASVVPTIKSPAVAVKQSRGGGSESAPAKLGELLDSMLRSGVGADGNSGEQAALESSCLSSEMLPRPSMQREKRAANSTDPDVFSVTPLRRSKRNEAFSDMDSLEKAMKRTASWNLDKPEGDLQGDVLGTFLVITTEGGGPPDYEDGMQTA